MPIPAMQTEKKKAQKMVVDLIAAELHIDPGDVIGKRLQASLVRVVAN